MTTEVWFRNPYNFIREMVECGTGNVAWDRGTLITKRIDPIKHASLYFGNAIPYRILTIGEQGTAEYGPTSTRIDKPLAVYPTWRYGEDAVLLEEIVSQPIGIDTKLCNDMTLAPDERPVLGQEHRVVIIEPPRSNTGPGRSFLKYLKELQEEYPSCIIHVHGFYGWQVAFGLGFRSVDIDPRTGAAKGKVTVPAGREMTFEAAQRNPQWLKVLGFKPADLEIPRNRCLYNIKSALWAGKNYQELVRFRSNKRSTDVLDSTTPDSQYIPAKGVAVSASRAKYSREVAKRTANDKIICNACSLQLACKYYREGAVCTVPGAEPAPLARFFKTRDSGMIIDGLSTIMAIQTRRLESGMVAEETFDELDPEVTKILSQLFDQGVKLAKLVDPTLRSNPKVGIVVNPASGNNMVSADPRVFVAQVVRSLEAQGIPRSKITPELVQATMAGMTDPEQAQRAIEGTVLVNEHGAEQSA